MAKRILAAILTGCLCLALCACGSTVKELESSPEPVPIPNTPEPDPVESEHPPKNLPVTDPTPVTPSPLEGEDGDESDPPVPDLVVDYIGPDGEDSRKLVWRNRSLMEKAAFLLDSVYSGKNTMLSPLSAYMAIGMAATGADQQTKSDLEILLGSDVETFNDWMHKILTDTQNNEDVQIEIANGVWVKEGEAVPSPEYEAALDSFYQAVIQAVEMDDVTVDQVNKWVSEKTHGMIPSIANKFSPETASVILNALYFDAPWFTAYEDSQISEGTFTGFDQDMIATFMNETSSCGYMENDKAVAFEKYYKDGYTFIGILPKAEGEFTLSELDLDSLLSSKSYEYKVISKLPKFEFDSTMELTGAIQNMGISNPFSETGADFSKMFSGQNKRMYLSSILQKTKIEVSETGTKAAAATGIMIGVTSVREPTIPEVKEVLLDRPFAFIIMDNYNQMPLFMGKVLTV